MFYTYPLNFPSGAKGAISLCCNLKDKYKTYKKFIWSFKKLFKKDINIILIKKEKSEDCKNKLKQRTTEYWNKNYLSRSKPVSQYSSSNKFIKKWKSIKDASGKLNICRSSIHQCVNNKRTTAGSFIWKYKLNSNE